MARGTPRAQCERRSHGAGGGSGRACTGPDQPSRHFFECTRSVSLLPPPHPLPSRLPLPQSLPCAQQIFLKKSADGVAEEGMAVDGISIDAPVMTAETIRRREEELQRLEADFLKSITLVANGSDSRRRNRNSAAKKKAAAGECVSRQARPRAHAS